MPRKLEDMDFANHFDKTKYFCSTKGLVNSTFKIFS